MEQMLLTKEITKAARGLLEWSAPKLSAASGVPLDTIKSFESGRTKTLSAENQDRIQKAMELEGVQFLEAGHIATGNGVSMADGGGE